MYSAIVFIPFQLQRLLSPTKLIQKQKPKVQSPKKMTNTPNAKVFFN